MLSDQDASAFGDWLNRMRNVGIVRFRDAGAGPEWGELVVVVDWIWRPPVFAYSDGERAHALEVRAIESDLDGWIAIVNESGDRFSFQILDAAAGAVAERWRKERPETWDWPLRSLLGDPVSLPPSEAS